MSKGKDSSGLKGVMIAGGALVFYACVLPILDGLATLARTAIDAKMTKIGLVSAQDQEEINEIAARVNGENQTQVVGFSIPDELEVEASKHKHRR